MRRNIFKLFLKIDFVKKDSVVQMINYFAGIVCEMIFCTIQLYSILNGLIHLFLLKYYMK